MEKAVNLSSAGKQNGFVDPAQHESLSDREVIALVLQGDVDFFEVLLRRYNQQLYRIARSYLSEEEDVKEVMQNAYLKAFEHLDQFRADAKFSTWLVRITIHEALKHLNQMKRYSDAEIDSLNGNEHQQSLTVQDDPEQQVVRADLKRLLEETIDTLPEKYRSVFIMREIEQMNTSETAECLDISRPNVKVRLFRAKKMLRKELEKQVLNIDIFDFKGKRCDALVRSVMNRVFAKMSLESTSG